jgi:hypothetical protein
VLDPFIGTGTTALAAEKHGRDWLGIELNPAYAEIAEERITAARHKQDRTACHLPGVMRPSSSSQLKGWPAAPTPRRLP